MNLEIAKKLENKYNFIYPDIYYTLLKDNMLDWGVASPDWYHNEFYKLKANPPLLLFGHDFEAISVEEIIEEMDYFLDQDSYPQTKKEFRTSFVPFAQTDAGDLYCFYFNKEKQVSSIVLVFPDANKVTILAKNLEDFMFRQLLGCVLKLRGESSIMDGDFKENIENQLSTHKKYLPANYVEILTEIYGREITERDGKMGLLSRAELNSILEREINFEDLNKSFEYQEKE